MKVIELFSKRLRRLRRMLNQLSVRFAAGDDQLAQLVRRDQDLASENERLDKSLIEPVSQEPRKLIAAEEEQQRARLQLIATERAQIQATLGQRFPDFAALSKPQPITVEDTQILLADDEALVILDLDTRSYAWVITRTSGDWIDLSRDSPDDPGTGLDIRGFPGSLQGRSTIRTATVTSGSPDGGRGADLAIFAGIWTHSPIGCS